MTSNEINFPRTGLGRRLASWVYDALVIVAFSMVTTVIFLFAVQGLISLDVLTLGNAIDVSDLIESNLLLESIRGALLIGVNCAFFVYFWTKGGQTIGMRSWRLKVQNLDGSNISIKQAIIRALTSLLGLGNLLVVLDFKNKRALQDYAANTEMVTLTKEENKRIYQSLD
jgi:uncharacterized RDD family membrane protein YckC